MDPGRRSRLCAAGGPLAALIALAFAAPAASAASPDSLRAGDLGRARAAIERAAAPEPGAPETDLALALAFKRRWLESLDEDAFRKTVECLDRAAKRDPQRAEPWIEAAALALARGNSGLAARSAMNAHDADPGGAMSTLALACATYRLGRTRTADSLFEVAIGRLPAPLARRFREVGLVAGGPGGADADTGGASSSAFWSEHDPDPTTPESEVRLDYCARLGEAILLFRDGDTVRWDLRTDLLVRYGLPSRIEYNRPTSLLQSKGLSVVPESGADRIEFGYPFNEQVWDYPQLGMRAVIWDRSLRGRYTLPVSDRADADPRPNPAALAGRPDLVVLGDGRGVFRALPPGRHPIAADTRVARFPSAAGARVVGDLSTAGGPADTLRARWVVLDAARREVARGAGALGASACDPTGRRTAEFAADLPPGDYRVGFAVEDARGGQGLATLPLHVGPASAGLALSDLVLLCGDVTTSMAGPGIRLEPNFASRVSRGRAFTVYFELGGLEVDARNESRFAIRYRVRRTDAGPGSREAAPALEASREEDHVGTLRRQFLRVPAASLAPGDYALEVEAKDLIAGASVRGAIDFAVVAER